MLKRDFSDYQVKEILKNVCVIVDTRENANKHIISYFEKKKIPFIVKKLDYGDYGLLLKKNDKYGLAEDLVLDYAVERKGSLEELSGNLTKDRTRFEEELWRGQGKLSIVIENTTINNITNHKYDTKYNEKSFLASLFTFLHRYNIDYTFTPKKHAGEIIFALLYYKLREELK
jgi:ERCC4-type nuclease